MEKGMQALDAIILSTYNGLFPRPARDGLERIVDKGPLEYVPKQVKEALKSEDGEVDEDIEVGEVVDDVQPCQVRQGKLKEVVVGLGPNTVALSCELRSPNPKDVFKVRNDFKEILKSAAETSPRLRALKIGKNFTHPRRVKYKSKMEKAAVKAIFAFNHHCQRLKALDLRDVVISKVMLAALCEMPAIRSLAFHCDWYEVADVGCQKPDFNLNSLANNSKIILLDVRGYGHVPSPPMPLLKMMAAPKYMALSGLSARCGSSSTMNWLFSCVNLKYLDLEVENPYLFEDKMYKSWACLKLLTHCKIYSTIVAIPPPLRYCHSLQTLILDMPLEGNVQDWGEKCFPKGLIYLAIMHIAGYKKPVTPAFADLTDLRLLYISYYGTHPVDSSFIALPRNLEHFVLLEDNNLQSENWDYVDQGRRLRGEFPGLKFKVNAYAIPCRDELWKDVYDRVNKLVRCPVVFDWSVPCFNENFKFEHEYQCKSFFYEAPKRPCDPPPENKLYKKCIELPLGGNKRIGLVTKPVQHPQYPEC